MKIHAKALIVLSAFLFGVAWLVPNHYAPWASFYSELPSVLGLLALAAALYATRKTFFLPPSALFIGCISLIPVLQFGVGQIAFFGDALMAACYLMALGLSVALGFSTSRAWGAIRLVEVMASVILIGALVSVVLSTYQWLGLTQWGVWVMDSPPGRAYANLAQPNNLATLFCMGLAGAIYLRQRGMFSRGVLAFLAVLLFAGVAMTRSRSALMIGTLMIGWILSGRSRCELKISVPEIVVGGLIFALMWLGWAELSRLLYLQSDASMVRLQMMLGGELRLLLWQQMLDALSLQPLFGYGWGQVRLAQISVVADYPPTSAIEYAHNFILDILVWNGWLIGGLLLVVIGWWMLGALRRVSSPSAWFALLVVMAVGVHGMVEFPHAYLYFLLPVGLCVGVVCHENGAKAFVVPRVAHVFVTALASVATVWVVADYKTIESDYRLMRFESIGIERRAPNAVAPHVTLLTNQREFIKFARTQAREGMPKAEIIWMEKVAHRYSSAPALLRYALALGLNNEPELATLELKRLKHIYPVIGFNEVSRNWAALVMQYPRLEKVEFPVE